MKVLAQHQAPVPAEHKLHETMRSENHLGSHHPPVGFRMKAMKQAMLLQIHGSIDQIRTLEQG
jgi:hypothetical protein